MYPVRASAWPPASVPEPFPINRMPANLLPDPKQKETVRLSVVSLGYAISICGNILLMLSPIISKKAGPITQWIAKQLGKNAKPSLSQSTPYKKLYETLSDQKKLVSHLWRILGLGFLLQLPMEYKTSLNCKQPSMFTCNLITSFTTACTLFSSNLALRVLTVVGDVFHRAGKINDIENSNHLSQRRELDIRRLPQAAQNKKLDQELQQFRHFMSQDLKQVFSLKPWQNLFHSYRQKDTWTKPNANLSALAGQFSLIAGCNSLLSTVSRFPGWARNIFRGLTIGSIVLHDAMFQAPIFMRGWQNRDEWEGKLVVGSVPFYMLGSPFFLATKYLFMNSFTGLANPFWAKGINLNSQHRLATINYLKKIHQQAQQQPLTADVMLSLLTNREAQASIQKQTGKSGFRFILQVLQAAATAQKQYKTPLATFLYPIILSKGSNAGGSQLSH
jgi:hypothetical protein